MLFRLLLASMMLASCAHNETASEAFTSRVAAWRTNAEVQGVAVAIFDGDKIEVAVDGLRMMGGDVIEPDDSFSVASVSKSFTAAGILHLVELGAIQLGDSAASRSGLDIPGDITIAHLLRHEAGLPEYMGGALSFEAFLSEHADGREAWSPEEIREFAISAGRSSEPKFSYSNAHYVVLGAIIEKQSGKPLASALNALVFVPAGLTSPRLVKTDADDPDALGYSANLAAAVGSPQLDRRLARELATSGDAAGGIAINASDLAHWAASYFSGNFVAGVSFAAPNGGEAFGLASDRIGVGPGVYEVAYGDRILRVHGGDGLGVTALAVYDPASGRSVAILVNDEKVRSLGFGKPGFLDEFAIELLDE